MVLLALMHVDVIELVQGCKKVDGNKKHLPNFLCYDPGHNGIRVENHRVAYDPAVKFNRPAQNTMRTTVCDTATLIEAE